MMPPNYGAQLTDQQLKDIVEFIKTAEVSIGSGVPEFRRNVVMKKFYSIGLVRGLIWQVIGTAVGYWPVYRACAPCLA